MRVAVYVPCYNGAAWIEECVGALLAQTRQPAEVAVVDDGSTDDSAAIVRRCGAGVRLIRHDRNRGLAVARNTALREIECDVLASVDADVRAAPGWLAELLTGFDSPAVGAVSGKLVEAEQERYADRWRARHMAQHAGDFPLRAAPTLVGATMAVRRDLVRSLGGYDESLRTNYEDADLRVRLLERGYRCAYVPDSLAHHLRTDTPRSVLRTYWGWLRPPAERRGAFASAAGLAARRRDVWERVRRMLWLDVEHGAGAMAYLTLLMGCAFPVADAAYAQGLSGIGARWTAALPRAIARYSPAIAECIREDLDAVGWWEPASNSDGDFAGIAPEDALERIPTAWWHRLERARDALALAEGWRRTPPTAYPPTGDPDVIAVLEHGTPPSRLRVTREHTPHDGIAAHRVGWLPPAPLQQSLLSTGRLVAGDPAVLDAIPYWRPEQVDPLVRFDDEWLFTWHGAGLPLAARDRWKALRARAHEVVA